MNKKYQFDNLFMSNPKPCGKIVLYQLGEIFCERDTEISEHRQILYEFTYILEGKGVVITNGQSFTVKKDDCYWSIIGDNHKIVSDVNDPLRFCYVAYSFLDDSRIIEIHQTLSSVFKDSDKRFFKDSLLKEYFSELLSEISLNEKISPDIIECALKLIIHKSFRKISKLSLKTYTFNKSEKSFLVYQVTNYIDKNIFSMKSLKEIEEVFNYNYQYIARCFNKIMNKTLNQYFFSTKMIKASQLLLENMKIAEIAEKLNYSCTQAFSYAFFEYFKETPDNYRKKMLSENQ